MRRIFFLYNNYEREHISIELICKKLESKNFAISQGGITDKNLIEQLFRVRPHIIFTFPITTQIQVDIYMMAKLLFHSKIITFTTEGLASFHVEEVAKIFAGNYSFPAALVDYHIYWGKYTAKYMGRELYRQSKVIGKHQIKVFGNPMYEKVYNKNSKMEVITDECVKVLVLTGFHLGAYTKKELITAQDIVNVKGKSKEEVWKDEIFNKYCEVVSEEKAYCEKYIQHVIDAANENPDVLFVVKLHPQEILMKRQNPNKLAYLKKLKNIENIRLIEQSIPVGELLPHFNLLVHYGSTVDLEAYIYKVPTVKLELRNVNNNFCVEANRLTESTYYVDIDESNAISRFVDEIKKGKNLFRRNSLTEKQLYGYMNYIDGQSYTPSMEIANFLSGSLRFHKLDLSIVEKQKWIIHFVKKYLLF